MMVAIQRPSKNVLKACEQYGVKFRSVLARAQTAGGVMRQIYAQWRKEIALGVVDWNCISIRHD